MTRLSATLIALIAALSTACEAPESPPSADPNDVEKSSEAVRSSRRLFDGAPPVAPHEEFKATCTGCHNERGMEVAGLGYAPPTPHADTQRLGEATRCVQCHVFPQTDEVFRENEFQGLAQNLRRGARLADGSPPVMPHATFMRENCLACHTGPAARDHIRTSHPERVRCTQCHLERIATTTFPDRS